MKIPLQDKIAELERRIEALECRRPAVVRETRTTERMVDLEPEMGLVWKAFDSLFVKLRGRP